ncbi:MAG: ABC transporter substrate-binding protein [Candidatus Rokubacteria bacterium]|nr:ABC transporter substrate-binding protein [Candidatus Rokubacteria bacterium]
MDRIRIVVAFHSPFYTPVHVAHRLGAFRDEGLDATLRIPPPGGTVDMIQTGDADLALSGVMRSFVQADRGGKHLVAIAEVNSRDGFFIVSRRPASGFAWRDLEGKRLALFGLAPTPWMCLQLALREHGVDPGKVHALEGLDPAAGVAALENGDADYLQTGQPTAEELVEEGRAHLVTPQAPGVAHVPYSSFIVTPEVRRDRPELCQRAVNALARALRWMAGHDGAAIADLIAPDFPEIRPPLLRNVVTRYHGAGTWSDGPRQDRAAFERLGGALVAGGLIRHAAPYESLVDDSFAQTAARTVGR